MVFPETCDEGFLFNSDVLPNTCRTNCVLPFCGDNVLDTGEACDDGNQWGGDGCNNLCSEEEGVLDIEANDTPALATPLTGEAIRLLFLDDLLLTMWIVLVFKWLTTVTLMFCPSIRE